MSGSLLLAEAADLDRADRLALLCAAAGRSRAWLFAHGDEPLPAAVVNRYRRWVAARRSGRPVAYLTGRRAFWTLELAVSPAVLIPRPETELLVERALAVLEHRRAPRILDLGTGSGALALALASERADAEVCAVDSSEAALALARENARRCGLEGRVRFRCGDWFAPVAGLRFDLIVANPPYLAADDPHLAQGDLRAEPRGALVAGPGGLEALARIVAEAPAQLAPAGVLIVEHGWEQQPAVLALCDEAGLGEARGSSDLAGRPRLVVARRDRRAASRRIGSPQQ